MKTKACGNCGLIQLYDEIWGLCICDSKEAFLFGCPEKELVMETLPDAQYDETITPVKKMTRPFIFNSLSLIIGIITLSEVKII